ncbi:unnamed protein product, partial [Tetraodon nigroviridis]
DQPEDGPQLYILLFGFYHPLLIAALDDVGVHVSCVVRLCSEGLGQVERSEDEASGHAAEAPPDLDRKLSHFWSELVPVLNSGTGSSRLPDVVQLSYTVQSHGAEAELETGIRMYGGVAALLYGCLEKRRQHQRYLRSTRLVSVPVVSRLPPPQPEVPPAAAPRAKKKGEVEQPAPKPGRCLTPALLRRFCRGPEARVRCSPLTRTRAAALRRRGHALLLEPAGPSSSRGLLRAAHPALHAGAGARTRWHARTSAERHPPSFVPGSGGGFRGGAASRAGRPPRELPPGRPARPLPAAAVSSSGSQRRGAAHMAEAPPSGTERCGEDNAVSWREVERFLHQSVFESMPLTRLGPDGVLERSSSLLGVLEAAQRLPVLPWDDPPAFASLQLRNAQAEGPLLGRVLLSRFKPSLSSRLNFQALSVFPGQTFVTEDPDDASSPWNRRPQPELVHLQSCRLRSLSHWRFSERHDAAVFSQVLPAVWDQFCCVDVFPGRLNNMVYVFCHNPTCPSRHSREFWDVGLHTDVRFRDYLEHVAETISDWTREEERKRAEEKARRLSPAERPEGAGGSGSRSVLEPGMQEIRTSAVPFPDLQTQLEEEPVIREGSLKVSRRWR